MNAWLRDAYSWGAGIAAGVGGFFADINWLAALGALGVLLGAANSVHAMWARHRRNRERLLDAQIDQITGD